MRSLLQTIFEKLKNYNKANAAVKMNEALQKASETARLAMELNKVMSKRKDFYQ